MIISHGELLGLSVISGGQGFLSGIPQFLADQAMAVSAMEGLCARGIVDKDGRVTGFGMVPVRVVEQYRNADQHVCFNQIRVSVNDDGAVTVIRPVGQDWHLSRMSSQELLVALLKTHTWLCGGGFPGAAESWEPMTIQQWIDARPVDSSLPLVVRNSSVSGNVTEVISYDVRNGSGFAFDLQRLRGRSQQVWQIRSAIAGFLGCLPENEPGVVP